MTPSPAVLSTFAVNADDVRLLHAVAQQDPTALRALHDRYSRRARAVARRVVLDDGLACDVVQEVFLTVWRAPHRYHPDRGSFASWLLAVTHHRAVDTVRRENARRRHDTRYDQLTARSAVGDDVEQAVCAAMQDQQVRDALSGLSAPQRHVLVLAYFHGRTQREIAEMTGAPLGTVKTRTQAGLRHLRRALPHVALPGGQNEPGQTNGEDTSDPPDSWQPTLGRVTARTRRPPRHPHTVSD